MTRRAPPISKWIDILEDVRVDWPWPYTLEEIDALTQALPAPNAARATAAIVREARRYLSPPAAAARATSTKSSPDKEIEAVARSVDDLLHAMRAMNTEAWHYLTDKAAQRDEHPDLLLKALFAFEMNQGLRMLPPGSGRGRKAHSHLSAFQARVRSIYEKAHADDVPARGWPAFHEICLKPIDPTPPSDPKARQNQLRRARKRMPSK